MGLGSRSLRGSGLRPLLVVPFFVIFGAVYMQPASHAGVAEATQLGARDLVLARLVGLEPRINFSTRHGVLLEAQVRQEEAVDDIPRLENHPDRLTDRHMDVVIDLLIVLGVELAVRAGVE